MCCLPNYAPLQAGTCPVVLSCRRTYVNRHVLTFADDSDIDSFLNDESNYWWFCVLVWILSQGKCIKTQIHDHGVQKSTAQQYSHKHSGCWHWYCYSSVFFLILLEVATEDQLMTLTEVFTWDALPDTQSSPIYRAWKWHSECTSLCQWALFLGTLQHMTRWSGVSNLCPQNLQSMGNDSNSRYWYCSSVQIV